MGKTATATSGGVFGSAASAGVAAATANFSRTDTASGAAGSGNRADSLTATTTAARLTVNLTALTGTSPTIAFAVWDSADNTTFAAVPGVTIAAMSATGTASLTTGTGTAIRRYVAIATTVTGTTPSATFTAALDKHIVTFTPASKPDGSGQKDT